VTRAVGLRAFFAEDVTIELPGSAGGEGLGQTIRGREEIAGLVTRMAVPPEGTRVQILKMDTELAPGSDAANVRVDTRVVARQPKDAPPILDARMIALTLRKVDGAWLIASARVMPTDDSLGVR
jgi:hypothetical protein